MKENSQNFKFDLALSRMSKEHYIIGICGGSGSGKTCFVRDLRDKVKDLEVSFISLDNYYFPREQQKTDDQGIKNFDLPESIDAQSLEKDIKDLISGNPITTQEYTFNNEKKESRSLVIDPSQIIVVEGLFIYHYEKIKDLFDLKLYIEADEAIKVSRRIKRDRIERNYPLEDVLYRYENHVLPSYNQYIEIYKKEAHLIINNNKSYKTALDMVSQYIRSKYKTLTS